MKFFPRILIPVPAAALVLAAGCREEDPGENPPTGALDIVSALRVPEDPEMTYAAVCAVCHGPKGEGNRALAAPSIAGLPAWYVKLQIVKFRDGQRGYHEDDVHGRQMGAVARLLAEESIQACASQIEAMERIPTTWTSEEPKPDIEKSRLLFANVCMPCHRFNGTGERVFQSSPLVGLPDWYLTAQMKKYRDGLRGHVENDQYGAKMVEVSKTMTDEEIEAMSAYIAALAAGDDPRRVIDWF